MKIVVITATATEQTPLLGIAPCHHTIEWVISGMGATNATRATLEALGRHSPDVIMQVGIAGAMPHSTLSVGEVVQVSRDRQCDLGAWRGDHFEPFDTPVTTPNLTIAGLRGVSSRSANTACLPPLYTAEDIVEIESMEGAAFFDVCAAAEGVRFAQIRSISNRTDQPRHLWEIEKALRNLRGALEIAIQTLV